MALHLSETGTTAPSARTGQPLDGSTARSRPSALITL